MTRPASISVLKRGVRQCIEAVNSDRVDDDDADRLENVACKC
jgi:hypothetical protein